MSSSISKLKVTKTVGKKYPKEFKYYLDEFGDIDTVPASELDKRFGHLKHPLYRGRSGYRKGEEWSKTRSLKMSPINCYWGYWLSRLCGIEQVLHLQPGRFVAVEPQWNFVRDQFKIMLNNWNRGPSVRSLNKVAMKYIKRLNLPKLDRLPYKQFIREVLINPDGAGGFTGGDLIKTLNLSSKEYGAGQAPLSPSIVKYVEQAYEILLSGKRLKSTNVSTIGHRERVIKIPKLGEGEDKQIMTRTVLIPDAQIRAFHSFICQWLMNHWTKDERRISDIYIGWSWAYRGWERLANSVGDSEVILENDASMFDMHVCHNTICSSLDIIEACFPSNSSTGRIFDFIRGNLLGSDIVFPSGATYGCYAGIRSGDPFTSIIGCLVTWITWRYTIDHCPAFDAIQDKESISIATSGDDFILGMTSVQYDKLSPKMDLLREWLVDKFNYNMKEWKIQDKRNQVREDWTQRAFFLKLNIYNGLPYYDPISLIERVICNPGLVIKSSRLNKMGRLDEKIFGQGHTWGRYVTDIAKLPVGPGKIRDDILNILTTVEFLELKDILGDCWKTLFQRVKAAYKSGISLETLCEGLVLTKKDDTVSWREMRANLSMFVEMWYNKLYLSHRMNKDDKFNFHWDVMRRETLGELMVEFSLIDDSLFKEPCILKRRKKFKVNVFARGPP